MSEPTCRQPVRVPRIGATRTDAMLGPAVPVAHCCRFARERRGRRGRHGCRRHSSPQERRGGARSKQRGRSCGPLPPRTTFDHTGCCWHGARRNFGGGSSRPRCDRPPGRRTARHSRGQQNVDQVETGLTKATRAQDVDSGTPGDLAATMKRVYHAGERRPSVTVAAIVMAAKRTEAAEDHCSGGLVIRRTSEPVAVVAAEAGPRSSWTMSARR